MITLNQKVKDSVTGFEGIATAISTFLHGCAHICVTSAKLKEGAIHEEWIEESRLDKDLAKNPRPVPAVLGTEVKDTVTGFKGIATVHTEFHNGCVRIGVTSKKERNPKTAAPLELHFDEQRLGVKSSTKEESPGGPGAVPPSRDVSTRYHQP
jgi:hypothetical protein